MWLKLLEIIMQTSLYARKIRCVLFGKRRYEEWKDIFIEEKESNFVLKRSWLFKEGKHRTNQDVKRKL